MVTQLYFDIFACVQLHVEIMISITIYVAYKYTYTIRSVYVLRNVARLKVFKSERSRAQCVLYAYRAVLLCSVVPQHNILSRSCSLFFDLFVVFFSSPDKYMLDLKLMRNKKRPYRTNVQAEKNCT